MYKGFGPSWGLFGRTPGSLSPLGPIHAPTPLPGRRCGRPATSPPPSTAEPSWHRRARRVRCADRILLALDAARLRRQQHHGGGMLRRGRDGDSWRCDNPGCWSWTCVGTSSTRCFRCEAPATPNARTAQGVLLETLPPGLRERPGFVSPGAAAAVRGDLAVLGSRRPWPLRGHRRRPLVLLAASCRPLRRRRRRHADSHVAALVLGPSPTLLAPRVISVWSTVRLRRATPGMPYVRQLRCLLAPLPAAPGLVVLP